jgi:cell division protein FtsB
MNRWPINPRRVAAFVGILVLILMVMDFNARLETLNLLKKQEAIVRTQATQAMQTQAALQTQVAYASSDQVVHEWARSEGHYIQSGDQPVVPVGVPGEAPGVLASPTPEPTALPNWQVWWNLFFSE